MPGRQPDSFKAMSSARYVGGPFDGGSTPETSIEIQMRTPAGNGRYVLDQDEEGVAVYRWQPDQDGTLDVSARCCGGG